MTKNEIVKVGDLGIARVLESGNDFATTIVGTPYYMSPEIFSQKPYGQKVWKLIQRIFFLFLSILVGYMVTWLLCVWNDNIGTCI